MLKPYTETQKARIAANILKAVRDPQKLTKQSYDFLNLCAGFIAHYNHAGFVDYYARGAGNLRQDLLENRLLNQWRNYTPKDEDYLYYQSKADIYNRITSKL